MEGGSRAPAELLIAAIGALTSNRLYPTPENQLKFEELMRLMEVADILANHLGLETNITMLDLTGAATGFECMSSRSGEPFFVQERLVPQVQQELVHNRTFQDMVNHHLALMGSRTLDFSKTFFDRAK